MPHQLTLEEAAAVLRRMMAAPDLRAKGGTWAQVYAGDVTFTFTDQGAPATVVIFNDADELDYVQSISCSAGEGNFDTWWPDAATGAAGQNPLDLLSGTEQFHLEMALYRAPLEGKK